ncbi:MAG: DUF1559 domain-containing protein [Planctomycetaceae bacterium]|jgi:prepilin-type processing-associated H-X9-DG protein|nr:DUF1559 domain-containing protein [Planctomycetaceae bacterium]
MLAFAEKIQGKSPSGTNDLHGLIWFGSGCYFNTYTSPNTTSPDIVRGWAQTAHEKHPMQLGSNSTADATERYQYYAARSWHSGGVNTAYADGSD